MPVEPVLPRRNGEEGGNLRRVLALSALAAEEPRVAQPSLSHLPDAGEDPRAPRRASSAKRSASRATSADFVIAETGFRNSAKISRQRRVMPSRRSIGW